VPWITSVIPATWEGQLGGREGLLPQQQQEAQSKRIMVQTGLGKKWGPISKTARARRAGGVAQAIEHLPSKHEATNSNPSIAKKIKVNYKIYKSE
jgi:hypothetical protein